MPAANSRKEAGQAFDEPTKRCIAKEAASLADVPLGLDGKTGQRVHGYGGAVGAFLNPERVER